MTKTILDISVSLDGRITDADGIPQGLHDWAAGDTRGRPAVSIPDTWRPDAFGAVICGRRTYEDSLPSWGADGPSMQHRLPVVVLSRSDVTPPPDGGVYSFAETIDTALATARALAHGKHVTVMGGANAAQAFLRAGLLDELKLHLVPTVLGIGTRLFADADLGHLRLEQLEALQDDQATHLRYRVRDPA
jgi:dihydrofolate reductase